MQYQCVHCDHAFDFEGEGRPRCPKCMRVHDIRQVQETAGPAAHPMRPWLALALVVLTAAGLFFWYQRSEKTLPETAPSAPLDPDDLAVYLQREAVKARGMEKILQGDGEVEAFARAAAAGKSTPEQKARAIVEAIRGRANARAFVEWSRIDPRDKPPVTPERVIKLIEKDGAANQLYPLEVAALTVAALRSVGVEAMLAEAFAFEGDRSPPDPSGRLGYFVPVLSEVAPEKAALLDPYGGRSGKLASAEIELLTDLQAVGLALNLRAIHLLHRDQDLEGAMADADAALKLAPRSPSVRGVRALVMLGSASGAQAQSELEAASQIRPDASQRNNLAGLMLVMGDVDGAAQQVSLALQQYPDYAAAHVTLASVHMARMEQEQVRAELETAERLDSGMPLIHMVWAQYHAGRGEWDEAVGRARQGVEMRPNDAQARLMLGRIYREAGRYPEMREQARAALELVPGSRAEEMKKLIHGLLGPTALDDPDEEQPEAEEQIGSLQLQLPEPGKLELGKGLRLLDDDQAPGVKVPLTDTGKMGLGGTKSRRPLLLLQDPKKLPAGDSDSR